MDVAFDVGNVWVDSSGRSKVVQGVVALPSVVLADAASAQGNRVIGGAGEGKQNKVTGKEKSGGSLKEKFGGSLKGKSVGGGK